MNRIVAIMLFMLLCAPIVSADDFYFEGADLMITDPLPGQDLEWECYIEGEADEVHLYYRIDGGDYTMVQMVWDDKSNRFPEEWEYELQDPAWPSGTVIDYYFEATHLVEDTIYYPSGPPGYLTTTIEFNAEAFGVYFDIAGTTHVFDTTSVDEEIPMRICLRYPRVPGQKAQGSVYAWDLQLRFSGPFDFGDPWTYRYGGTNDAKSRTDKNGDLIVDFLVTQAGAEYVRYGNTHKVAETTLVIANPTDVVQIYLEPRGANHAPMYKQTSGGDWLQTGSSSGGNPNDPSPDWSLPVAQINTTGAIMNEAKTWSGVKALFR